LEIIPTKTHLDIEDVLNITLLYRHTVLQILGSVYDLVRMGIDLNFIIFLLNSRLICRWDVGWLDYDQMCKHDTLDSDV